MTANKFFERTVDKQGYLLSKTEIYLKTQNIIYKYKSNKRYVNLKRLHKKGGLKFKSADSNV